MRSPILRNMECITQDGQDDLPHLWFDPHTICDRSKSGWYLQKDTPSLRLIHFLLFNIINCCL